MVSVPGTFGTNASYTFNLVQPIFSGSPYYQLQSTQTEAAPGATVQAMEAAENQILQQKIDFANSYVNTMLDTMTMGMALENVGMQGACQLGSLPSELPEGIVAEGESGTTLAQQLGQAGEEAAQIVKNTQRIPSLTGTANYRVPDVLNDTMIGEVKNVQSLSYTSQLQDYAAYAQQNSLQFHLWVRPSTELSGPLQDAISNGQIILHYIPGAH